MKDAEAAAVRAEVAAEVALSVAPVVTNTTNVTTVQNTEMVGVWVPSAVYAYRGVLPAHNTFRSTVITETLEGVINDTTEAVFAWRFLEDIENVYLIRVSPDDELLEAYLLVPEKEPIRIDHLFDMIYFTADEPKGETRELMLARGLVDEGEILPQNVHGIYLGNLPAGSQVVFRVKDTKLVNAGLFVAFGDAGDSLTINLDGTPHGD